MVDTRIDDATYTIDLSKMEVATDESIVDDLGNPANFVNIKDEKTLVCHPAMKEKVEQAIRMLFQQRDLSKTTIGVKHEENNEGGENE